MNHTGPKGMKHSTQDALGDAVAPAAQLPRGGFRPASPALHLICQHDTWTSCPAAVYCWPSRDELLQTPPSGSPKLIGPDKRINLSVFANYQQNDTKAIHVVVRAATALPDAGNFPEATPWDSHVRQQQFVHPKSGGYGYRFDVHRVQIAAGPSARGKAPQSSICFDYVAISACMPAPRYPAGPQAAQGLARVRSSTHLRVDLLSVDMLRSMDICICN